MIRRRWPWLVGLVAVLSVLAAVIVIASSGNDGGAGDRRTVIEEQGKVNAAATASVKALVARHGADAVRIRALENHRVRDRDLVRELFPEFAPGAIGCVIVVTAGDDGVVFVEDPDLEIIHEEPLPAFVARTRSADPETVARFYLSLA